MAAVTVTTAGKGSVTIESDGIARQADLSACGRYRWSLTRTWIADLPRLLVVMFNPSTADAQIDDPTIQLVCQIASRSGYGGIVVLNAVPLRGSTPELAIMMAQEWSNELHNGPPEWFAIDKLRENLDVIEQAVGDAQDVLIGWGALGERCSDWMSTVMGRITDTLRDDQTVYCLGKTKGGHPIHPLARGKLKVRPDAKLIPWSDA